MTDVQEEKNIYLSNFTRFEQDQDSGAAFPQRLRRAAMKRFTELGFPTLRNEDWKFTNVAALAKMPFRLPTASEAESIRLQDLERVCPHVGPSQRLVFVNGYFAPHLSAVQALPAGVALGSLAQVLRQQPASLEPHLAQYANYHNHAFSALNTAFLNDGAFVSLPPGTVVEQPIHLVFLATAAGEGCAAQPRNLVLLGQNCQVRLIESYVALQEEVYFTNAVTELAVGENATVNHYKVQRESLEAFHVATLQVHQARSSNFSSHYLGFGGALVRHEVRVVLDGEGCESTLNGLYLAGGTQHLDNHTVIDHALPHCASHELYKGILDGKAHGVFNGKIFVHQDAQKTDAKQTNQTLLLSEDAVINTKPQLEIYADDVKCTHGATVGQLDEESIFYLRSRGIGRDEARSLLTYAFANDIVGRIKIEPLREELEKLLLKRGRLSGGTTEEVL
jgi:Fe-S cluster assembly protein SufD